LGLVAVEVENRRELFGVNGDASADEPELTSASRLSNIGRTSALASPQIWQAAVYRVADVRSA
jgi:hypothetical protein